MNPVIKYRIAGVQNVNELSDDALSNNVSNTPNTRYKAYK